MNVIFVSQCQKKANNRTRRILDAFANRIGDNTWQSTMSQEGLLMVYHLLKKSATKNTAVSCHQIKTRNRTQCIWTVGRKGVFDKNGIVAVNKTQGSLPVQEHGWDFLYGVQIVVTLSALLHDIGKANNGFQNKLKMGAKTADPYRHEWISLKLIEKIWHNCQSDKEAFLRLANIEQYANADLSDKDMQYSTIGTLPPIAQWIAYLVVTHHRMPPLEQYYFNKDKYNDIFNNPKSYFDLALMDFYQELEAYDHWVKNPKICDKSFCEFSHSILMHKSVQKSLKRYAQKALNSPFLTALSQELTSTQQAFCDPLLLQLSKIALMAGDHNYSSLNEHHQRLVGTSDLIANTHKDGTPRQTLDEHLLGVAQWAGQFCRMLPTLHRQLPALVGHQVLEQHTPNPQFDWQNTSFDLAKKHANDSQIHGFFGVNMASTGCGKTIANARIMYALNPQGARLTIALGLRVLTLQTGKSYRHNLQLDDHQLAILVGGVAQRQLFDMPTLQQEQPTEPSLGSESAEALLDGWVDGDDGFWDDDFGENLDGKLPLGTLIADPNAKKLLFAPVVVCTIDHLMAVCENRRGGGHIVPSLRLFGSDLILDEPDDFDQNDLPALSRLVHWAGILGSKVLLSSATLPPALVTGLFEAYQAGRRIYNANMGLPTPQVVCAWFDENHSQINSQINSPISDQANYQAEPYLSLHSNFVAKRCAYLQALPVRRMGNIIPIHAHSSEFNNTFYPDIANTIIKNAITLHHAHHQSDNGYTASVGLVRFAHINELMQVMQAMYQSPYDNARHNAQNAQSDTGTQNNNGTQHDKGSWHIHLACYHSQQVLLLRDQLEKRLDTVLNRHTQSLFAKADIRHAIAQRPNATHHIFVVLATSVAEVGRDHDYDWAIVEPSSMRSIIQLAGRVGRHRQQTVDTPNIGILQYNIKALNNPAKQAVFCRPGFEGSQFGKAFLLASHDMNTLVSPAFLHKIDARPRIATDDSTTDDSTKDDNNTSPNCLDRHKTSNKQELSHSLIGLEHTVLTHLMSQACDTVVNAYWRASSSKSHLLMPCLTPFRHSTPSVDYVARLESHLADKTVFYALDDVLKHGFVHPQNHHITPTHLDTDHPNISPWLHSSLACQLERVRRHSLQDNDTLALRFGRIVIDHHSDATWYFDERFGAWKK